MVTRWNGEGTMPEADRQLLRAYVAKAHARGRRIRFWGVPNKPAIWKEIYEAGVDLINADDLPGLRTFLLSQK